MIFGGIDAGSRATKVVLYDAAKRSVLARGSVDQGIEQRAIAWRLFEGLLAENRLQPADVQRIVATGYGRHLIDFADAAITEITCHARGVAERRPDVATVIEIGGQDSKLIRLNGAGTVHDFAMNDRCAAGTGRFLEMVATRLGVRLADLGALAAQSEAPVTISSMCVVFAETEIIGLLASGCRPTNIVAGVQAAIAARVGAMAGRSVAAPVCFTGGVALVGGMAEALSRVFRQPVSVAETPVFTGALGAALLAAAGR